MRLPNVLSWLDKNNIDVNETPSDEAKEKAIILVANGWNVSVNGGLT